jgi:hypothetical protein
MRFSHCTLKVFKTGFKRTRQHGALTAADDFRFRLCETYPARLAVVGTVILVFAGAPVAARDPGQEAYMIRILACRGPDAKMEVYLPQQLCSAPQPLVSTASFLRLRSFRRISPSSGVGYAPCPVGRAWSSHARTMSALLTGPKTEPRGVYQIG